MTVDLETLNENQREAVLWDNGPLLVLAGPGSGKTRVLTVRIARLIEGSSGKHFKILGLTFTNKAAAEMRERIASLVPDAGDRTLLTTFHSFAADLLRQHGHHVGLKPDFTILVQDADRQSLLEEALEEATAVEDGQLSSERVLPVITRLTENCVAPADAATILTRQSFPEAETIGEVYGIYRRLMVENNVIDFAGLIAEAIGLLEERDGVRKQILRVYRYVCVDEFQDTNLSQYRLLRQLVNPESRNLFVVADDDQIIYQWNGADPRRLWELRDDFEMSLLQLPENYRCPPSVVEIANKLIANNFGRFAEKGVLTARKKPTSDSAVTVKGFEDLAEEIDWVSERIASRPLDERLKCAVLARTKRVLEQVIEALGQRGVSGYLATRKNEFESAPLQWLHSVLRLANARSSRDSLRRVCKSFYRLEGVDLNVRDIVSRSSAKDGDYLRGWSESALNRAEISEGAGSLLENALPLLSERMDFWKFQDAAFRWLDSLPDVRPDESSVFDEYEDEKHAWLGLVAEIKAQYGADQVTLHLLLQELDLRSKAPPPPKGAVPCFTIHAAKGLEFDHVYFVAMVEDQLPSWAAIKKGDDSREMQEERRECFVGITRAQETLTLTYSDRVFGWAKRPSRFLYEMGLVAE